MPVHRSLLAGHALECQTMDLYRKALNKSQYESLQAGLEQERQSMDLYDRNIDEVDNNEQRQASADY